MEKSHDNPKSNPQKSAPEPELKHSKDEKLRQREENFRTAIERVSDAFVALDKIWCYTYMNKRAGEIFGVDPEAMIGKHIWTEFPEGIDQPFYKAYYKAMAEQKYIHLEDYYEPYDKWFANHIYPSPEGLTIYFTDITERKKAEEKMRINEARLTKSQEIGKLGYWELEKNSEMIWGSAKTLEIFGFPPDISEIPIEKVEACIPAMDKVRQAGVGLISHDESYDIELKIHPADGSPEKYISAIGEIANDRHGRSLKIMGVVQDITERKIAEQKLLKAYNEIDVILKSITDGFLAVDKNWTVKYWNKAAKDIMRVEQEQIVGKNFWDVFADAIPTKLYPEFKKAMDENISGHFDEYYPRVDIWFRFNVYPSQDGLTVSFQDITEIKRYERLYVLEKETLELSSYTNAPLEEILTFLLNGIQKIHPEMICSVLRIEDGKMYTWAAPLLPKAYNQEVEGLPIGIGHGSCGSAAFLKEKVEAMDISTHPYWKDYKEIALSYGLKACWSYPIFDSRQNLLGTFGIYYTKVRALKKAEELTIERARVILVNIIENKLAQNALKAYKDQLELIYNTSNDVIFLISVEKENRFKFASVNHAFLSATGLEKNQVEEKYVDEVIPQPSRALVLSKYNEAVQEMKTVFWTETTDYPSGRKTGIVRISPVFNKNNDCTNLLGTVHDISERIKIEEEIRQSNEELKLRNDELSVKNKKLEDIAWIQSHKVRAPLARILGLVDLLTNHKDDDLDTNEILNYILTSSKELDGMISEIVRKTESL
jgi:PAS domain S-box-containing protein